jgi:hypothetical protein
MKILLEHIFIKKNFQKKVSRKFIRVRIRIRTFSKVGSGSGSGQKSSGSATLILSSIAGPESVGSGPLGQIRILVMRNGPDSLSLISVIAIM